jgi:predicted deacylase
MPRNSLTELTVYEFRAGKAGPVLLFLGAIHGNEKCGTRAIMRVIADMHSGKIKLQKGRVIFVPIANPLAYEENVRFVDENLNRIFKPTRKPRSNEARLANALCRIIDRCDVMLDLHSTTAQGQPFIYLDFPTPKNRALAKILGPKKAISGWPELYKKLGKVSLAYDTTSYAAKQGKDCLLIECGQHQAPSAEAVAYKAVLNSLRHYGMMKGTPKRRALQDIKMSDGYFRESARDRLAADWKHLDKVRKGEVIIYAADGSEITAPYNAYVIMPKATARVGEDWLYLGKKR